ncbi:MAG: hypothetical protein KAG53_08840 [Endozoicomonadaceae bacterium]|nr:hypothetical protein [Endozoicomonadaceae bacterium]
MDNSLNSTQSQFTSTIQSQSKENDSTTKKNESAHFANRTVDKRNVARRLIDNVRMYFTHNTVSFTGMVIRCCIKVGLTTLLVAAIGIPGALFFIVPASIALMVASSTLITTIVVSVFGTSIMLFGTKGNLHPSLVTHEESSKRFVWATVSNTVNDLRKDLTQLNMTEDKTKEHENKAAILDAKKVAKRFYDECGHGGYRKNINTITTLFKTSIEALEIHEKGLQAGSYTSNEINACIKNTYSDENKRRLVIKKEEDDDIVMDNDIDLGDFRWRWTYEMNNETKETQVIICRINKQCYELMNLLSYIPAKERHSYLESIVSHYLILMKNYSNSPPENERIKVPYTPFAFTELLLP